MTRIHPPYIDSPDNSEDRELNGVHIALGVKKEIWAQAIRFSQTSKLLLSFLSFLNITPE